MLSNRHQLPRSHVGQFDLKAKQALLDYPLSLICTFPRMYVLVESLLLSPES
jgi:hypothetical protein